MPDINYRERDWFGTCLGVLAAFAVVGAGIWIYREWELAKEKARAELVPPGAIRREAEPVPAPVVPVLPVAGKNSILTLRTDRAVIVGVKAWVEVDGKNAAKWDVGEKEVSLELAPGTYEVAVKSIYRNVECTIFERQITLVAGSVRVVDVGP